MYYEKEIEPSPTEKKMLRAARKYARDRGWRVPDLITLRDGAASFTEHFTQGGDKKLMAHAYTYLVDAYTKKGSFLFMVQLTNWLEEPEEIKQRRPEDSY